MKNIVYSFLLFFCISISFAQEIEYNNKNEIVSVTDNNFLIKKHPQAAYKTIFKDGKPFDGYYKSEEIILDNIPVIHYYEKGVLKKKFYYDYLDETLGGTNYYYTIETTFEDNKIKSGYEYLHIDREPVVGIVKYENFKITSFYLDAFAVHAFARFSFELKDNKLEISKLLDENKIIVASNGKELTADFYKNNQKVASAEPAFTQVKKGTPESTLIYYTKNGIDAKSYSFTRNTERLSDFIEPENEFLFLLFIKFPNKSTLSCSDLLNQLIVNFKDSENFEIDNLLPSLETVPFHHKEVIYFADYNENGSIDYGAEIKTEKAPFVVDFYESGEKIETKIFKTLMDIKNDVIDE